MQVEEKNVLHCHLLMLGGVVKKLGQPSRNKGGGEGGSLRNVMNHHRLMSGRVRKVFNPRRLARRWAGGRGLRNVI